MTRRLVIVAMVVTVYATSVLANDCGRATTQCCPAPCTPCRVQVGDCCDLVPRCEQQALKPVERTVMVPEWTTEVRKVKCTEYRQEKRTREVTVYEQVPVRRTVNYEVTDWVQETRQCQQSYTVCRPVWRDVKRTYTVNVPHVEQRQGVRNVWRCVPVKQKSIVCEDHGHWEQRAINTCATCSRCRRHTGNPCQPARNPCCQRTCCIQQVWVPNIVQREVEQTVMQWQCVQEPCTYQVTVCRPEQRTCTVRVCEYKRETKQRTVTYTVCVPKKRQCSYEVTEYKCVPTKKTEDYTVCVPHEVQRDVRVRVCKMVPKKVTVQVPSCEPACCSPRPVPCCP